MNRSGLLVTMTSVVAAGVVAGAFSLVAPQIDKLANLSASGCDQPMRSDCAAAAQSMVEKRIAKFKPD